MAGMQALRKQAKAAGVSSSEIRSAESSAELRSLIKRANSNGSTKGRVVKKASAVKKSGAKRGRPKGSKNASASAKAGRAKATRRTSNRSTSSNGNGGRNMLTGIRWSQTDGWNPREGSVPDVIVKALRKAKGDREKAYNALKGQIDTLVPRKTRDGRSRNKEERQNYLRYLISRNAWAFAIATGQHEQSSNRVEYGTGGTGEGIFKRNRKAARKASTGTAKRGRPKGSKNARKATGAKRGRPAGSKNKAKAAGRKAARKR